MKWKQVYAHICFISLLCLIIFLVPLRAAAADLPKSDSKAVVFVLDASNSMNSNDRSRLAIDSIAQLIYSLPSNYSVGVVAYNTDVVAASGMADSDGRDSIMEVANAVRYTGYTNAGAGLARAIELLDTVEASQKTVVMLSDGEIVMQNDAATAASSGQFQNAVTSAKESGTVIHVIGLGSDMENTANTIFSASAETGGSNYHAPRAEDIQQAVDAILLDQLNVKKTTAAVVDADGGTEELNITIPSANASTVRILFISDSPIRNLVADFNAGSVRQVSGTHYTLLELARPTAENVHVRFQGEAGSQVNVDVITEYSVVMVPQVTYEDVEPEDTEAANYDRTARISLAFCDAENPERQVLTDTAFEGRSISGTAGGQAWTGALLSGSVTLPPVSGLTEDRTEQITVSFDNLETNVIAQQPLTIFLEGAPAVPEATDYRPAIIGGAVDALLVILLAVYLAAGRSRKKPRSIPDPPPPAPSKYSYTGRLNLYITRTKSGRDVPPLTYDLFRIPSAKILSLQEILDGCNVTEHLEGADKIFFKAGANRCLVLSNDSDCTIMQNREILMKGRSYLIGIDTKVDITFEDEISEMALQYRQVRPNELRSYARV